MYRTDLALENRNLYYESQGGEPEGVVAEEEQIGDISVTRVKITSHLGAESLGKPIGTYVTIDIPQKVPDRSKNIKECSKVVSNELRKVVGCEFNDVALIVGLGNDEVTPDSLGPKVTENIEVTRHMFALIPEELQEGIRPVCALTPGVLGTTGIETAEIIRGVVERVNPKVVIAIDSLAARKMNRISRTIQISNTGINPGAGIGNYRNALSEETLGVPVVAVGVPAVVSSSTLVYDVMEMCNYEISQELIAEVLASSTLGDTIVTPKDIDEVMDDCAEIISTGINRALHKDEVWGD